MMSTNQRKEKKIFVQPCKRFHQEKKRRRREKNKKSSLPTLVMFTRSKKQKISLKLNFADARNMRVAMPFSFFF